MLIVGEDSYPLCLLDTLAVSEMVKRPRGAFKHFLEWSHDREVPFVPCFTVYALIELRRKPTLFSQFIEHFDPFPCVLLKGYMELIAEEVEHYPNPSVIDVCAVAFTPLGGPGNQLGNLPYILDQPQLAQKEEEWNREASEIVDGMVSLVANYPPAGATYTDAEVRDFVSTVCLTQLYFHGQENFIRRVHARGEAVDTDAFLTLKAMTYTVFHKFYVDATRKPAVSDAFDVLMSALLPYVEAVITEAHLAEALGKTTRRDGFLRDLQVFTLRDFRTGPPKTAGDTASS